MQTDYYYLAMEYCPDGDLKNQILRKRSLQQKFDIKQVVEWAVQIASALKFCHDRKVIHRDLKVSAPLSIARARRRLSCARGSRAATAVEPVARLEPAPQAQRLWTRGDAQAGE